MRIRGIVFSVGLLAVGEFAGAAPPDFEREVASIFESRCLSCHDRAHAKGKFVLESREAALEHEGAIVPGKPDESRLVEAVSGEKPEMPPKGRPLTAAQVDVLRRWIAAGAPWPEGRTLADKPVRDANWWSLQPIKARQLPAGSVGDRNAIDSFIRAKLAEHGLQPTPEAAPRELIRRVTFDLIGLPPHPDDAIKPRLLVAGPADRDQRSRLYEEDAYPVLVDKLLASPRYGERWARHWLDVARFSESQGFERDKLRPDAWHYRDYVIDAFNADKPYDQFVREQIAGDVLEPVTREGIIATGFLVGGPWDEVGNTQQSNLMKQRVREEELEEIISAVGQTFLGVTINCARCHAHKFDPIPQEDYYSFKAVFEGVRHGGRPIFTSAELIAWQRLNPGPTEAEKQAAAEKKQKGPIGPQPPQVYAARTEPPPPTHLLERGDVLNKQMLMTARGLSAVAYPDADLGLSPAAPEADRRRRFAAWLTDPANPLVPRVLVNRVWHYHFGRGLVETPNDLGASGGRPSHPELLDWLSAEFIRSGWSIKHLHRLILTSATYRQSSAHSATSDRLDADNRWLWRFAPRRLDAEAVRDALLAVSGELNGEMHGPGFQSFDLVINNSHFYHFRDKLGPDFNRRTIYRTGVQSLRNPLLDSLDCPDLGTKAPVRGETTTPIQALALMNDSFVLRQCFALAARLRREVGESPALQVRRAYQLTLGREPSADEARGAEQLAAEHGLEQLAWVLFNSTEFIYVR